MDLYALTKLKYDYLHDKKINYKVLQLIFTVRLNKQLHMLSKGAY